MVDVFANRCLFTHPVDTELQIIIILGGFVTEGQTFHITHSNSILNLKIFVKIFTLNKWHQLCALFWTHPVK